MLIFFKCIMKNNAVFCYGMVMRVLCDWLALVALVFLCAQTALLQIKINLTYSESKSISVGLFAVDVHVK